MECLEAVLCEPGALVELYIVFDCDATRTDVLENTFKVMSDIVVQGLRQSQATVAAAVSPRGDRPVSAGNGW